MTPTRLMIGWTTTESREDADKLARGMIEAKLAACAQISGPIDSVYRWQDRVERSSEFRIAIKFPADKAERLEAWIHENHPYETPQWVACAADRVSEKYLKWTMEGST